MSTSDKRAQRLSMIADWQQSGKSKKRYCEENSINQATFYYWFSRSKANSASSGNFIPIAQSFQKSGVEIIYPNGVRLKIDGDLGFLSELIHLY